MKKIDTFANRLAIALKERGMKQVELCEKAGVGKSSLSQYLAGQYEPRNERVFIFAEILDVSPAWLLGYDTPIDRTNFNIDDLSNMIGLIDIEGSQEMKEMHQKAVKYATEQTTMLMLREMGKISGKESAELIADYMQLSHEGQEFIKQTMKTALKAYPKEGGQIVVDEVMQEKVRNTLASPVDEKKGGETEK